MVVLLVHEVHRRARDLDARFQHRLVQARAVAARPGEGRDQGRMHVDGAPLETAAQLEGREETEQEHEVEVEGLERGVQRVVEVLHLGMLLARHGERGDAAPPGALESKRRLPGGDHDRDAGAELPRVDALAEVLEARARAREEHADPQRTVAHGASLRCTASVAGARFIV